LEKCWQEKTADTTLGDQTGFLDELLKALNFFETRAILTSEKAVNERPSYPERDCGLNIVCGP
jgi:hypothetical protein